MLSIILHVIKSSYLYLISGEQSVISYCFTLIENMFLIKLNYNCKLWIYIVELSDLYSELSIKALISLKYETYFNDKKVIFPSKTSNDVRFSLSLHIIIKASAIKNNKIHTI